MTMTVNTTETVTTTVSGNLHANQITFQGDNLVNADGICIVSAKVFVNDGNGGYLIEGPDYLATATMSIGDVYSRTYLNGTITGAQVLGALAEMCDYMWTTAQNNYNQPKQ